MIVVEKANFTTAHSFLRGLLLKAPQVDVGTWQSQDISDKPMMITHELQDVHLSFQMPSTQTQLVYDVKPSIPWAEDHFQERVSGLPLNPPPSEAWWPYAQQGNAEHKNGQFFSHTYPERFWPRRANILTKPYMDNRGIRYQYGDLGDLVALLKQEPYTRQAYLPVWFPEDTGNVPNVRVPCTLGYHFMFRNNKLTLNYFIRSCDFVRHFRDDVYMAIRLVEWVINSVWGPEATGEMMGKFNMIIPSLHCFAGDMAMLQYQYDEDLNQKLSML